MWGFEPKVVPLVPHEGGGSLVPCLSPPSLQQVGLPGQSFLRWGSPGDPWELPPPVRPESQVWVSYKDICSWECWSGGRGELEVLWSGAWGRGEGTLAPSAMSVLYVASIAIQT